MNRLMQMLMVITPERVDPSGAILAVFPPPNSIDDGLLSLYFVVLNLPLLPS
jgi:hypothetical protein